MRVTIRNIGTQEYVEVLGAMQRFTETRNDMTQDEIWVMEHHPVYTQGLNGKAENIIDPGNIPVIQTDRGGQCTYHGPGQLMAYVLIDINRKKLGVRALVSALENPAKREKLPGTGRYFFSLGRILSTEKLPWKTMNPFSTSLVNFRSKS